MKQHFSRRSFYTASINLLGAAMSAVVALPAAAYLFSRSKPLSSDDLLEVADVASLPVDKPREVLFLRTRVDGWKQVQEKTSTWLVKDKSNRVTAFVPACTHLGCAYHWEADAKSFLCPCHNSEFDLSGNVMSGPAPRPLDQMLVQVENGKVLIDPNSRVESNPA